MKKQQIALTLTMLAMALAASACSGGGGGGGGQPQSGFFAQGRQEVATPSGGTVEVGNISITGDWLHDNGNAVGQTRHFDPVIVVGGDTYPVQDGRVPARWSIRPSVGVPCISILSPTEFDVNVRETKKVRCLVAVALEAHASPNPLNLQAPPVTFAITGSGFTTTNGMPRIEYYDQYSGVLLASANATSVSNDGTWLRAGTPDLSSLYSGTYSLVISNVNADGSSHIVSVASVTAYGRDFVFEPPRRCSPTHPCTD